MEQFVELIEKERQSCEANFSEGTQFEEYSKLAKSWNAIAKLLQTNKLLECCKQFDLSK